MLRWSCEQACIPVIRANYGFAANPSKSNMSCISAAQAQRRKACGLTSTGPAGHSFEPFILISTGVSSGSFLHCLLVGRFDFCFFGFYGLYSTGAETVILLEGLRSQPRF